MFWSQAFALSALAALVQSAPLSRVDAESAKARMKKLMTFTDGFHSQVAGKGITDCKARSATYATKCASTTTCKKEGTIEDLPNSLCCDGGRKECKNDENGKEIPFPIANPWLGTCCDYCVNPTAEVLKKHTQAVLDQFCSAAGQKKIGATVCGTSAATCTTCTVPIIGAIPMFGDPTNHRSFCERSGLCQFHRNDSAGSENWKLHYNTGASICNTGHPYWTPGANATWQPGKYTMLTTTAHNTQAKCEAGKCMQGLGVTSTCRDKANCEGTRVCSKDADTIKSKDTCESSGGKWTLAKWTEQVGKTRDTCIAPGTWEEQNKWENGKPLPAQGATDCTTGPTHEEPSALLPTGEGACLSQASFLADASAGKTVADAMSANATYYAKASRMILGGASLVNHVNASTRAEVTLNSATCFVIISQAKNHGKFVIKGSSKTYALILEPTNFADADDLQMTGGSASVLGGSNAGNIVSTTTGSFEVYSLTNRGNVHISGASNVIIADVQNKGGNILVTNMPSVTLINVQSYGNITANGAKGNYKGYDIVNTGMITIHAGTIDLHFKCNKGGTVTVGSSVTGKISYENGCKGTITVPSAVTLTELGASAAPAKKVSGSIKFKVPSANAAAFKTEPKVKKALQSAIADMIDGVDFSMVEIISVTRRLDENNGRRLADTSVSVNYVITLPATSTVTAAKVSTAMTGTAAKSALKTGVNKELVNEGVTAYSVSAVEELSKPAESATTGTGSTTGAGSASSTASITVAVSTMAVAFMGMIAVQLTL